MKRVFIFVCIVLGGVVRADDTPAPTPTPTPTPADLAAAKKVFDEGNALYKAGKLAEAVERIKESYRLSRNVFLLYNIGHIYDQLGNTAEVLVHYRQFLAEAPADAPMRPAVAQRVEVLERATTSEAPPEEPTPAEGQPRLELHHVVVDSGPPAIPFDVTMPVLADATLAVTLHFRGSGEVEFTTRPMVKRAQELVGHIPGVRMAGNWVQYYLEVRDSTGKLVARSGRPTSPHLIYIEDTAKPKFYPDLVEPGENTTPTKRPTISATAGTPEEPSERRWSPLVVGKWIATGSTAALLGGSIVAYLAARKQHDLLVEDSTACGEPPCREFDHGYARAVQDRGARYDAIYKVTLVLSIGTAGVAGYLWYRDLTSRDTRETAAKRKPKRDWIVAPAVGDGFAGAAAGGRF